MRSSAWAEIKRSFRRLAHRYHPDRNAARREWAERKMRQAIEAYRVVGNFLSRSAYDRRCRLEADRRRDGFRERLLREKHRPGSRAQLILHDLMQGRGEEALATFEEGILENGGFDLAKYLSVRDWLDCTVLLAEQYEQRGRHEWALDLYEAAYAADTARKCYGHFYHEIRDRIRHLCCRVLAPEAPCDRAVAYYTRALRLELTRSETAYIHKKIAECYFEADRPAEALEALRNAFRLSPRMKGARRICEKLGFRPGEG